MLVRLSVSVSFCVLVLCTVSCRRGQQSPPPNTSEPVACADIYQPVCAADGNTYSNACKAQAEGQTSFEPGECKGLGIPGVIS